ncbi:MAG TPA: glycosyltransferase, partial [Aggregatilineaceae bacterium]|nr:glycosyltransferase [Aggregatilineaceae bacterium]
MKKVVFLMSDTGGGHRAAADAIRVAMEMRYPDQYTFEIVDVYRRYTPFPFNSLPDIYPPWVNWAGMSWSLVYRSADAPLRSRVIMAGLYHCWKRGLSQMVAEHNADVIVPAHALFSRPAMRAFQEMSTTRPPFVTVITDLVSTHAFWYEKEIERYLAPTQAAYDRGLMYGLAPEQIRLTGLPVNPHFIANLPEKCEARARLHWQQNLATVLLVGGGDGMGPVYQIARAINARHLPIQLVIVAGRNGWLKRRLDHARWNQPTYIYPFVKNMSEFMAGADILITKAGPATISEACIAGLPMILSGAVP